MTHARTLEHRHPTGNATLLRRWLCVAALSLLTLVPGWVQAQSQDWPNRPVRLVVPYPAGGGVDILARALAQKLQETWGQPVTVDNRPGANTLLGTEAVARSTDQHSLLFTTDATFTINPHLYAKLPYDLERDFQPVTHLVSFSQLLVVPASLPVNSLKELIELARSKPGALSYASYGPGSQPQLATETIKQKTGVDIVHVPYRGIPQAVMAVVSGEVPMTWSGIPSARGHLAGGKIKALAYGGKTRSPVYPDVPTVAELGLPEVDANVWVGLFAPATVAPATVQKIHRDVLAVISEPEFRRREVEGKTYDFVGHGAEAFKRHIAQESANRKVILQTAGIKIE